MKINILSFEFHVLFIKKMQELGNVPDEDEEDIPGTTENINTNTNLFI